MDYLEFRKQYEEQHPASIPRLEEEHSPYPKWTRWGVFLMFLSAAVLSGVHTIPVAYYGIPGGDIIGEETRRLAAHSSFVAVELAILFSAFVLLVKSSMRLAYIVIGVCFFIAMVANVTSIAEIYSSGGDLNIGGTIVSLAFGVGMPFIALMAGKLFVNIHNTERGLDKKSREALAESNKRFDAKILAAYNSYQKAQKQPETDVNLRKLTAIDRPSPKMKKAIDWLREHPEHLDTESRVLAGLIGVSHTLANDARKIVKQGEKGYTNGLGDQVQ